MPPQRRQRPKPKSKSPKTWDAAKPCENYSGRDEADLCQQWRMAKATEETKDLTDWQNWIVGVEAGLLFLTLIATAIAAVAAAIGLELLLRPSKLPRKLPSASCAPMWELTKPMALTLMLGLHSGSIFSSRTPDRRQRMM